MTEATRFGNEFLVNTTTEWFQHSPAIAGLTNGRFVAAWTDYSQSSDDPADAAVRAQVFNADGSKAGDEFLVNSTTALGQTEPAITPLSDGRFVIGWSDASQSGDDTSSFAVRAQVFEANGTRSGAEFVVPHTTANDQLGPAIAGLSDGRFVAAWQDNSQTGGDTSEAGTRAQIFKVDGNSSGDEFLVNTTTSQAQYQPVIASLANGHFAAAWTDLSTTGGDTTGAAIRAQVFGSDGKTIGSELLVNTTVTGPQSDPSIIGLADGRFVVAWTDGGEVAREDGGYAVRAQIYDGNGTPDGGEFTINTVEPTDEFRPQLAALPTGGFVAAWLDNLAFNEAGLRVLHTQIFDRDGLRSGAEITVNTAPDGYLDDHAITVLADGRFVVTWEGMNPIGDDDFGTSIHAQIFDSREAAIDLGGTPGDDDFIGTGFNDKLGGSAGDDRLDGAGGDDTFRGGSGADTLIGGAGTDTAVYSGHRADYQVITLPNGDIRLVDQRAGSHDGADTTHGVEIFQFVDGSFTDDELFEAPNQVPIVAKPIADCSSREDAHWTFQVPANSFSDPDGDRLTYTSTLANGRPLPAWLSFDAATGTFSGTPPLHSQTPWRR